MPGRGQLAWRVFWITIAFYLVAYAAAAIRDRVFYGVDLSIAKHIRVMVAALIIAISNYWAIFVVIAIRADDVQHRNWRVSMAWLCITAPIVWYMVVMPWYDPKGWMGLTWFVTGGPFLIPPIVTFAGALLGDVMFRLYRRLHSA